MVYLGNQILTGQILYNLQSPLLKIMQVLHNCFEWVF